MSRKHKTINDTITVHFGDDHAIGKFYDIVDSRAEKLTADGEGYLVEYCELFGFMTNLIGITEEQLKDKATIISLCNNYICNNYIKDGFI